MLRHKRLWLAGLTVVLTGLMSAPAAAADLKYLPADTEILITLNFKQILDSDLVKGQKDAIAQVKAMVENQLAAEPDALKYLKATGFDLFRDLVSVTVAYPGKKDPDAGLVIVEGTFNPTKFQAAAEEAAKDHGDVLRISKSGDFKVFEVSPPTGKQAFIALAGNNIILACAAKDRLSAALGRHSATEKTALKKEFKTLLETTSPKQSLSIVATGNAITKLVEGLPIPQAGQGGQALQGIEGLSAAVTVTKDIQFQLGLSTKDAATAKNFSQQANFGLLFAKGIVAQKAQEDEKLKPLVDVVNTLRAEATDNSLMVRGQITMENLEKLMKNFKK